MNHFDFRGAMLLIAFLSTLTMSFAQDDQPKPIPSLKVFPQDQLKSAAASDQLFADQFKMANGNQMVAVGETTDQHGFVHQRFQQYFNYAGQLLGENWPLTNDVALPAVSAG